MATERDLREINELMRDASRAVGEAYDELTETVGLDPSVAYELLPDVPLVANASVELLQHEFATRSDFDSMKSYLRRIVRASRAKPRRGTVNITPDLPNNLTSFYIDDEGSITESAFMRSEQRLIDRRHNEDAMRRLRSRGITFELKPVYESDAIGESPVRDEWGHPVRVYVPTTPNMRRDYQEAIQENQSLAIIQPEDASDAYVDMWGDAVSVGRIATHRMSPKRMAESQLTDEMADLTTRAYFHNYRDIVDTTMPDAIANEIGGYIDAIDQMGPTERAAIYDYIDASEDDAGTIEYLYLDASQPLPKKVQYIVSFWRTQIAPKLGVEVAPDAVSLDAVQLEQTMEESGYATGGAQSVYGEYRRRKNEGTATSTTFDNLRAAMGIRRGQQEG